MKRQVKRGTGRAGSVPRPSLRCEAGELQQERLELGYL